MGNEREGGRSFSTSAELCFLTGFGSVLWFSESTGVSPAKPPFRDAQDAFLGSPLGSALETSPQHPPAARPSPIAYPGHCRQAFQTPQTAAIAMSCHLVDWFHFLPTYLSFPKIHYLKAHFRVSRSFLPTTSIFSRAESRPMRRFSHWQKAERLEGMVLEFRESLTQRCTELIHD